LAIGAQAASEAVRDCEIREHVIEARARDDTVGLKAEKAFPMPIGQRGAESIASEVVTSGNEKPGSCPLP
jgi:hypothetical protein